MNIKSSSNIMNNEINYSTIYNWFDKNGVISNIRTQLRQNLIHALKSKELTLNQAHIKSAKQYVYDVLIAEYLLKMNYAYTLSTFTSEALLPAYFEHLWTSKDAKYNGKLQNDYLQHILESLKIDMNDFGHHILSNYAKSDECLLICILQSLMFCTLKNKNNKKESKLGTTIEKLCSDKFSQTETIEDNCERCKHFMVIKRKLIKQKEDFDKMLNEKSEKLRQQALNGEQQLKLLEEKMEQVQDLLHSLSVKRKSFAEEKRKEEERLHQKKLELLQKEQFITRETNKLEIERINSKQFEENLQRLQCELTKIKQGLSGDQQKNHYTTKDIQVQTDFQSFTQDWHEKEILRQEKEDLCGLVREQQERIQQLTHRAVHFSRQLEEAQLAKIIEPPVPTRMPLTSTFISDGSSTEDILQDAKIRLQRLEEESIQAEKRYNEYILRSIAR